MSPFSGDKSAGCALWLLMAAMVCCACDHTNNVAEITDDSYSGAGAIYPDPIVAIYEDFNYQDEFSTFFVLHVGEEAGGDPPNNMQWTVDGEECVAVHAISGPNGNRELGYSVEIEYIFEEMTDMSGGDFSLSFDLYWPLSTRDRGTQVQFGLYNSDEKQAIYSRWYTHWDFDANVWVPFRGRIAEYNEDHDISAGAIDFDQTGGIENWQFDTLRIQMILNRDDAEGSELVFYMDNLIVDNVARASETYTGAL